MRRLLFITTLICAFAFSVKAQVYNTLVAQLQGVTVQDLGSNQYKVTGTFYDPTGTTRGIDMTTGDVLWSPALVSLDTCRRYVIDSFYVKLVGYVEFRVTSDAGQGVPSTSNSIVMREYPNMGIVSVPVLGLDALKECISRHYSGQVDNIPSGAADGNGIISALQEGNVDINIPSDSNRRFTLDTLGNISIVGDATFALKKIGTTGAMSIQSEDELYVQGEKFLQVKGDSVTEFLGERLRFQAPSGYDESFASFDFDTLVLNHNRIPDGTPSELGNPSGRYIWTIDQDGQTPGFIQVQSGNILWVAVNGNNSTAEKGNFFKPYADPQAAINDAVAGDLVYVLPGIYEYGTPGFAVINLAKQDVELYLSSGAILRNVGSTAERLFYVFFPGKFSLTGDGTIEAGDKDDILIIDNLYAEVNFKLNRYYYQGGTSSTTFFAKTNIFKKLNVFVQNYEAINSRQYVLHLSNIYPFGDTLAQLDFYVANMEYNAKSAPSPGVGRTFSYISGLQNTQVTISVDNLNFKASYGFGMVFIQPEYGFRNSNVTYRVESGKLSTTTVDKTNDGVIYIWDDRAAVDSISTFTFRCENCVSEYPIVYVRSTNASDTTVVYNIEGKYRMTGNTPVVKETAASAPSTMIYNMDVWAKNAIPINIYGTGSGRRIVSGHYRRTESGAVVNITSVNPVVLFKNLVVENAGGAAIQSSVATTVNVAGSFQNNSEIDSDVTFSRLFESGATRTVTISNANLTITQAQLIGSPQHRIVINTTAGAVANSDVTIPDASPIYRNTQIVITSLDDSGTYDSRIITPGNTQINPNDGTATNTLVIGAYNTITLFCVNTTGSTWRWVSNSNKNAAGISYVVQDGADISSATQTTPSILKQFGHVYVTAIQSGIGTSDCQVNLPTPAADLVGCKVIVFSEDLDGTYNNTINFGSSQIWEAGSFVNSVQVPDGQRKTVVCSQYTTGVYRWFVE